jgi:predicted transcriptional regulator
MENSVIYAFSNKLAQVAKYRSTVCHIPMIDWKRPVTTTRVSGFDLITVGILTAAESAVIGSLRAKLALAHKAHRANIYLVLVNIGDMLEVETLEELKDILNDQVKLETIRESKGINDEVAQVWLEQLQEAAKKVDLEEVRNDVVTHMATFIMYMRYSPDWDYDDTEQLSAEEKELLLDFIRDEENAVLIPEKEDKSLTVKKP